MTGSHVKYQPIPSSEEQPDHSDDPEPVGDDLRREWFPADAQTKWTYFLLGCAILLPWNGDSSRQIVVQLVLITPTQP